MSNLTLTYWMRNAYQGLSQAHLYKWVGYFAHGLWVTIEGIISIKSNCDVLKMTLRYLNKYF